MQKQDKHHEKQLIVPCKSNEVVVQLPKIMPPYMLLQAEPTLNVEIFLPKKDIFQGVLHDTLRQGLSVENVKNHFLASDVKNGVVDYLRKCNILNFYTDDTINNFPEIFGGYSLSEVDGIFAGGAGRIYNERTQIVKLIFRLDMDALLQKFPDQKRLLSIINNETINNYIEDNDGKCEGSKDSESHELRKWLSYIRLFVFGYVIYNICQHIHNVSMSGLDDIEEEIWVTSTVNTLLNRVVYDSLDDRRLVKPQTDDTK